MNISCRYVLGLNNKNKDKAKQYFKIAKDYGYHLEPEYEAFISI